MFPHAIASLLAAALLAAPALEAKTLRWASQGDILKKVFAKAKGFRGRRKNVFHVAKQAVMKAGQYAYRDRRVKKREFRALWIARINAGARQFGLSYSACHEQPQEVRDRDRPQGACRPRRGRQGRVREARRAGESPPGGLTIRRCRTGDSGCRVPIGACTISMQSSPNRSRCSRRSPIRPSSSTKARFLGKQGALTERLKGLGKLPPEEKRAAGARINDAKDRIEQALAERRGALARAKLQSRLAEEAIDVTLPGRDRGRGGIHPIIRTWQRIETIFRSIGFDVADGPEIETDWYNFTALNNRS